jgi:hypothetical protein
MPYNADYKGDYEVDRNMMVSYKPWISTDGDALWRTGIAFICYPEFTLHAGIFSCYEYRGTYDQPMRFPANFAKEPDIYQWAVDTVSRDQVAMSIAALRWGHTNLIEDDFNIRWRLSKRHWLTPDLWLWLNRKYTAWLIMVVLQFLIIVPWNALYRPIYRKLGTGPAGKLIYPHYSLFITVFMLAVVPDSRLARFARRLISLDVEKSNYVIQLLCGNSVDPADIAAYQAESFRWNRRLDEPSNIYIPEYREVEYNNIDIDLIEAAILWREKNIS